MKAGCIKVNFLYSRRRSLHRAQFADMVLIWQQMFITKTGYHLRKIRFSV